MRTDTDFLFIRIRATVVEQRQFIIIYVYEHVQRIATGYIE